MKTQSSFFRDKSGKIVIIQFPNWPLWIVFALYGIQLFGNPTLNQYGAWLARILLLYWSYLEIRFGVNGFRKALGVAGVAYVLFQLIKIWRL
jgi:hypothetical protein